MRGDISTSNGHRIRPGVVVVVVVVAAVAVALWMSETMKANSEGLIAWMAVVIQEHAILGPAAFVVVAALTSMLAFFSSVPFVPVAVVAWGKATTFALLWVGWICGGAVAYAIARHLGRAVITRLVSAKKLGVYEERIRADAPWSTLLLVQLALPSEIPGYLAGLIRYRFRAYVAALALGELPYAIGAVYLGDAFLHRDARAFLLILVGGGAWVLLMVRALHRVLGATPSFRGDVPAS
ncbi:MAG: VTT domain-containing protein [Deltaproteobacteria bacterium]|nr:VTT domain-containing protein [Deltaproteobacteria bacterium]